MKGHSTYLEVKHGSRDELVTRHAPLVKRLAHHLMSRLPPTVELDDLVQAGMVGLLEAASHFQADKGASFETFASVRIRGAMLDQLRRGGWAPRSISRQLRAMSEAMRVVENREGRAATAQEIAAEMGVSLDAYHELLRDTSSVRLFSLEQIAEDEQQPAETGEGDISPQLDALLHSGFQQALAEQIGQLPDKEKLVLALYYEQGLNLKEIGEVLEVSESRVCQIHGQAVVRLRSRLGEWTGQAS